MTEKLVPRGVRVRLAPGRRLRKDAAGEGFTLAGSAGSVQLNDSAAAILALCDGSLTREQIVARVLPGSKDETFAVDAREFLAAAYRRGWIVEV